MSMPYADPPSRPTERDAVIRIDRCSWCLHETAHAQVTEGFWLARGVFKCGGCARRTLPCRKTGCRAFARGRPGWDEDLCLVHRSVIPRWPSGAADDAEYLDALRDRLSPLARCSWCFDECRHALEMVTLRGAAVHACGGCARATHPCVECRGEAYAKVGDDRCAKCAGLIYDWTARDVNDRLARREGWCTWCGELCGHVVRDARREHCECLVCGGGTAPCPSCPGVMRARSGVLSGARHAGTRGACVRCDVRGATPREEDDEAVWEAIRTRRAAADAAAPHVVAQLERRSRFADAAADAGLRRPFALLATLPPRERVRLGMRLGISLARTRGYLDPHAEAWTLLASPRKGACARAATRGSAGGGSTFAAGTVLDAALRAAGARPRANWLEMLAATLAAGAETGGCPALDPREAAALPRVASSSAALAALATPRARVVAEYEEAALGLVADAQRARFTPAQTVTVDAIARHPLARRLCGRLAAAGVDSRRMARAAIAAAFAASGWSAAHDAPLDPEETDRCAEDVLGCLLDGTPPTNAFAEAVSVLRAERGGSGTSPSLLGAMASAWSLRGAASTAAQLAPERFAVLTREDVVDKRFGARAPTEAPRDASGLFETVAVLLTHNALLAARGVVVDDHVRETRHVQGRDAHKSKESKDENGVGSRRDGRRRTRRRDDASDASSPAGVVGGFPAHSEASDGAGAGSDRSGAGGARERVARWAAAAAREEWPNEGRRERGDEYEPSRGEGRRERGDEYEPSRGEGRRETTHAVLATRDPRDPPLPPSSPPGADDPEAAFDPLEQPHGWALSDADARRVSSRELTGVADRFVPARASRWEDEEHPERDDEDDEDDEDGWPSADEDEDET